MLPQFPFSGMHATEMHRERVDQPQRPLAVTCEAGIWNTVKLARTGAQLARSEGTVVVETVLRHEVCPAESATRSLSQLSPQR